MPLYIELALKYLFSIRSKALSFMTFISIIGITVGVSALLITLAVMSGFEYGLKTKIVDNNPHILVLKLGGYIDSQELPLLEEKLNQIKDIQAIEPIIYTQAVAKKKNNITPVFVKGIIPQKEKQVSHLDKKIIAGDFSLLEKTGFAVIGSDLAFILDVWIGDKINIFSPYGKRTPFGYVPKTKTFQISAIADFGVYELNSTFVAINLLDAQQLFNLENRFTGIQLRLKNPMQADTVKQKLLSILPSQYIIKSWIDINRSLFQALQLEKFGMFLVLTLIVLVASFNISSLLITKSREKRKEIAILKTLGATNSFILKIFIWQGIIIGMIGITLGLILGITTIFVADHYHLIKLNPEVYMIEYLPLKISLEESIAVVVSALVISFLSSLIPAKMASKEIPVEILRYE
ncbi:MAG: FtsX-like permease family protein [Aquificae bacterium]|nr:FtsX-like permease family protein [Aquificota bacterium]